MSSLQGFKAEGVSFRCPERHRIKVRCHSLDTELEVELPSAYSWCQFAILIGKGQTELNDSQQVDVAAKSLIVIVA